MKKSTCYKKLIGKKCNVFTPKERAELGKLACQIGSTAAAMSMRINESTTRRIKKAYMHERSRR